MTNSFIMGFEGDSGDTAFSSTSQAFFNICQLGNSQAITGSTGGENYTQAPIVAGILSNLWCRVKIAASGTSTVVMRINEANGNETFSIPSNTTGAFSDATHTDSVSGGQLIDVAVTPGSTSLIIIIVAVTFSPANANDTVTLLGNGSVANQGSTGTFYSTPSGNTANPNGSFTSTESQCKNRQHKLLSMSNLSILVSTNGNGMSTYKSRKNGSNANFAISIPSNSTGQFQDTTDSDSVVAGDDYDYTFSPGSSNFEAIFAYNQFTLQEKF
ncbi:MAG: hypothetical protein WA667_12005 [Candidatus Nitrosopolaris sp.]